MKIPPTGLLAAVLLMLLALCPVLAAAQAETYSPGQYAELNTVSDRADSRLSVTVTDGEYALAWSDIEQRWAVSGEEKLYLLRFRVRNDGQQVETIDPRVLQFLVTDEASRSFDEPLAFRLPGTSQSANARLVQSQSIDIETAFLIPADAVITSVHVADARSGRGPGVRFSIDSTASLPRELSPDGISIDPIVAARTGTWYPLGVTDVRIDSIETASEPIMNLSPSEDDDIAVVAFSARNRSNADIRIHRGLYRETSVSTEDGDRDLLRVVFRDSDRDTDFPLLPGDEVRLRSLFRIPQGNSISSVDFVERIGTRGGLLSRRYRIGENGATVAGGHSPTVGVAGGATGSTPAASTPAPAGTGTGLAVGATPAPIATGSDGITEIPAETPPHMGQASVPEGLLPEEELVTAVMADPVPIIAGATVEPEMVSVPRAEFVLRLQSYYVEGPSGSDESRPEFQLMVFNYKGRFGDEVFIRGDDTARRAQVTDRDVSGGFRYPLSSYTHLSYRYRARPFDIMALVFIMIERDDSSGSRREAYMQRMNTAFFNAFISEVGRDLGVDYDNLSPADADRIVERFTTSARLAADAIHTIGVHDRDIGGAADADEVSAPSVFFWINADDERNPGIITHSRIPPRDANREILPYPWPSPIQNRINPEIDPNNILRFEISKE